MGIIYLLTALILITSFVFLKKSDEKQNIIENIILAIITYLGYNIAICMIFGNLGIHTNLIFLSIVNLIFSAIPCYRIFKKQEKQEFYFEKKNLIPVIFILLISILVGYVQYKPADYSVATASVDGPMHYSAAIHFADEMIILSKIDNQTGYNFLTMQTGAYINTGIQMKVCRSIFGDNAKDFITFKYFEMEIFTLCALSLFMCVARKSNTIYKTIISMIIICIYVFAYPYTSLLYGFSYLGVGIVFCTSFYFLSTIYGKISYKIWLILVGVSGIGIIFSYCLFVPAMYAFLCITVFLKEKDENRKIFKKQTMFTFGTLMIITIASSLYLILPTFLVASQNKLTDAIGFDGGIYKGFYIDFIFYVPFIISFVYKAIKDKKFNSIFIALMVLGVQWTLTLIGLLAHIVSSYYYYKIYYILMPLFSIITLDVIFSYTENKDFQVFIGTVIAVYASIIIVCVTGLERRFIIKYPNVINDVRSDSLSGIYYETNVAQKPNIKMSCTVDENRVKIAEELGKHKEITLKNMLVGGMNGYCKAWLYVISNNKCGGESINDIQVAVVETTIDDFLANDNKEYFIIFTSDKIDNNDKYDVLFQNEGGAIIKKK